MKRNLKALGLTLVAAFAISAMAASSAQALIPFTAPEGAIDLTGSQVGAFVFGSEAGETKCSEVQFSGTAEPVANEHEVTLTPTFKNCTAYGLTSHVEFTECDYTFTTPTVNLGNGTYTGEPPHVKCPAGKVIDITPTLLGKSVCTITIEAQTPTGGHVIYKPEGASTTRDLLVELTITGFHYTIHYPKVGQTEGACGKGVTETKTDLTLAGKFTLKGYKMGLAHTEANHTAVTVN